MKYIVFFIWFTFYNIQSFGQADIAINPNATFNGESTLAVNPTNENNLVVAWMKLVGTALPLRMGIAVSYSNDGGATWSVPALMPHFHNTSVSADPTLVYGNNGTAYLCYIDYKTTVDSGRIVITKSTDGGATWSAPVKIIDNFASIDIPIDRPWLARDNSATSGYNGRLYLVSKSYKSAPSPHHIWMCESASDGVSWTNPKKVDDTIPIGSFNNSMGVPAVTSNGNLHIAYLSSYTPLYPGPRFVDAISANGGNSFTSYKHIVDFPLNGGFASTDTLYQFSYNISAHPSSPTDLITCWTDNRNGDPDIYATYTKDGGYSWHPATRVNDDIISNGKGQDMCWAGYNKNGIYTAAWRDRRNGVSGQSSSYQVYGANSVDGGITFTNFQLSQTLAPLYTPVDDNDFLGLSMSSTYAFATWTDKRDLNTNQLFINKSLLPALTAVNEITNKDFKFAILNNPVSNNIAYTLTIRKPISVILRLLDTKGSMVFSKNLGFLLTGDHNSVLNIPFLASGIYFLSVNGKATRLLKN